MAVDTSTVQVVMPAMGDSVAEGTVLEWHKQEGDSIAADETLVEISTDKVDAEVPSPVAGTVTKIHAGEGDTVAVGALLAEISTNGGAGAPAASSSLGEEGGATPSEAIETEAQVEEAAEAADAGAAVGDGVGAGAGAGAGQSIDIVTPTGGESVTEGTILEWAVKLGDTVKDGDTVVEISTDKVDMELPAPANGTITEILAAEGETVTVGQVIARMSAGAGAAPAADREVTQQAPAPTAAPPPQPTNGDGTPASPVARRVAAAEGVDLSNVHGSGPHGRIVKADVLAAKNGGNGAATVEQNVQLLKGGAAMLARYMDESRSIPTATSFRTMTVTTLDARRKQLKDAGHRVSFTHLIAYAIAVAATDDMPVMAHHFAEIDGKPHRVDDGQVNLGLAVDVEKKDGTRTLMVPVIRDAGRLD